MDHSACTAPQGSRTHLGQLLGHPSLQTKVFLLTPTCCCSGQELSDFNPCSLPAGLPHLSSGDPAVVEGKDVGEEGVPKPPACLKVVL